MQIDANKKCNCPICGEKNSCAVAVADSFDVQCWCRDYMITKESLNNVPLSQKNNSCICIHCVTKFELGN